MATHESHAVRPHPGDALAHPIEAATGKSEETVGIARQGGKIGFTSLADLDVLMQPNARRPHVQPWLSFREAAQMMANYDPKPLTVATPDGPATTDG